ncbi:acyl-CoA synthetase [Mycolicibacterium chubuense]|uniref:Long-chain-fatty-acid--AMP ligase FadD26 n=1 Tax=Mycolicibacterium chubuense TaxID=1800 RepID=A0A0J6ZEF0_MYCCU|nr:AMP-binding protein [Mycolicibacterium chubuense]KMO83141.1 Long-chain-fatty-acid--AMP ligase FadD26 [Mycolicibacterium chubuense]ORA46072.1 acyl-CoA synthetase [Mycolicibacterium chubuense]SPX96015.1 acyl-CoA synthetase (AMP-forming)/AMP-acid ligase II [Mycolicibacterium chubuense]
MPALTAPTVTTIPALLADRARQQPEDTAYTFVDYESDPAGITDSLTWSELHHRVRVVAAKLATLGSPGDRAVILAPQSLEYIIGFLGAIEAGFIAVPLTMPQLRQHDERVTGAMKDSQPVAVLTTSAVVDDIRRYGQLDSRQRPPKFIEVDTLDFDSPLRPAAPVSLPKTAYLQYTSGSTRLPAGVVVSHRNVLLNVVELLTDYYETFPDGAAPEDTTVVSWLPFYHDMGLIVGVFIPIMLGRPGALMSPIAFMQKPARWMQLLGSHPGAFTAAPNFAFELAVKRTSDEDMAGKDLSGVAVMINGAERVHGTTVRRFNERFAAFGLPDSAMRPSYGLAEATVYVVASAGGRPPTSVRFDYEKLAAGHAERCDDDNSGTEQIGLGRPRTTTVRVVDPETLTENPAGKIGEVWLHGEHVAGGYYQNPELTQKHFAGQLAEPTAGTPKGPWLRTGDLGVLFDDELYLVGRIKDLLIVDGRNHYPDDIEGTVAEFTGGRVAAISVDDDASERLVVIAELKKQVDPAELEAVTQQVTSAVSMTHSVRLSDFALVPPGSLPLTTSGKVRRAMSKDLYLEGAFTRLDATR